MIFAIFLHRTLFKTSSKNFLVQYVPDSLIKILSLTSLFPIYDIGTDEARFLAADVANALGYSKTSNAINSHMAKAGRIALKYKDSSETEESILWGKNDFMDKVFINESGLCLF